MARRRLLWRQAQALRLQRGKASKARQRATTDPLKELLGALSWWDMAEAETPP